MKTYFLYRHIRLDTKEVFYIGIGTNLNKYNSNRLNYKRAYSKYKRSSFWHSIADKNNYKVEILLELSDLSEIKVKETEFIKLYGRRNLGLGTLVNLTDGGELNDNIIVSEEKKEKLRKANLGLKHPEWRNKIKSKSQGGDNHWTKKKSFSEKAKSNMSEAQKKLYKEGYISPVSKKVKELDEFGNIINSWDSISKAGKYYNVDAMTIYNIIKGKISRKLKGKIFTN